jgi:hypothetical protein
MGRHGPLDGSVLKKWIVLKEMTVSKYHEWNVMETLRSTNGCKLMRIKLTPDCVERRETHSGAQKESGVCEDQMDQCMWCQE